MAKIKINKERCKGCELCIMTCPKGLISLSGEINSLGIKVAKFLPCLPEAGEGKQGKGSKNCSGCSLCAIVCPDCAIEVWK